MSGIRNLADFIFTEPGNGREFPLCCLSEQGFRPVRALQTLRAELYGIERQVGYRCFETHDGSPSAVRNTVSLLDLSIEESLRLASLYPAQMLGLDTNLGQI